MSKTDNLTDFLTDLADGFRAKTGTTEKINAQNMRSILDGIEAGGGGTAEQEYQPNADMVWARQVCENDVQEGFTGKVLQMIGDLSPTSTIDIPAYGAVKTSDGAYYTNDTGSVVTVTHTWDDTNARVSESYQGRYNKVRWVISYCDKEIKSNSVKFLIDSIYLCYSGITLNGSFHTGLYLVEYIDFINESNLGVSFGGIRDCVNLQYISPVFADITYYMFSGCSSLKTIPLLDTSKSTNMGNMFYGCSNLKAIPELNTIKVTSMVAMFGSCSTLKKIPLLDTSNVRNMENMFSSCYNLETIPLLNTEKVTSMDNMFYRCERLKTIPQLNTSNVLDMEGMFYKCHSLQLIPLLDTIKVTKMKEMFYDCPSLNTIPLLDTSNVTEMQYMFSGCKSLQEIPLLNTINVTNMNRMFYDCSSLKTVPQLNTSNVTDMYNMFYNCISLQEIPQLDTSNVTNMERMFINCPLKIIPKLNTSKNKYFTGIFQGCKSLHTIEGLDLFSATNAGQMFQSCEALTNLTLKNIKISLQIGSGILFGHLLTLDSLTNTINELWDLTGSTSQTLTVGSANLSKLANVYVKLIDITDEMRAEDEYIDNKKPFVVCESTDEGAMLISEYVTSKNWQLK